ncbi:hypothetical protein [Streptomyces flavidovirens]|uniref:Uncharacterized protein n=1 Tax=Streptomyces flavidovirens TaxID=67298 RepID=A0ABW6RNZ3_9ACTN
MTLSEDHRELLRLINEAGKPVAMSDFFHGIHPPDVDRDLPEDHPVREAWREKQINLYGTALELEAGGLVTVVHPADGERPDLVEPTAAGRAALV